MRLSRCGYLIREGFRSITTHGFMSFASVTIIMACLVIMGSVSLLSVNIDALIKDLENQNEIVAFVDENISDEDQAKAIQSEIDSTFTAAYKALQKANIEMGIHYVEEIADSLPVTDDIRIKARSIMGTEIPLVQHEPVPLTPGYAFLSTSPALDEARMHFEKVKELTVKLSMVENSAYRLASSIRKTQKRANALKNITIPSYQALVKDITNALEEKDRDYVGIILALVIMVFITVCQYNGLL